MLRNLFLSLLFVPACLAMISCGSGGGGEPEPEEAISHLTINTFLWKPNSHRDGNLTILINPENVRIEVMGVVSETLINSGASNGRGTTGRSTTRSGCEFGNDILLEFYDELNQRVLLSNGGREVIVPFGCSRYEFTL